MDDDRSIRAVKNTLPTPSGEVGERKALAWATGTSRRASGWAGEKSGLFEHPAKIFFYGGVFARIFRISAMVLASRPDAANS